MQYLLVIFGIFSVIVSALLIVVPFVRRRGDLVTVWSVFQISCANYLGVASIQSGNAWTHLYVTPHDADYVNFVLGGLVFYASSIFTYYFFKFPERIAQRTMVKVGPRVPHVMLWLLPLCALLTLGYLFVPNIQLLGQWMMTLGRSAAIFGVVFSFVAWAQRPFNSWFALLGGGCLLLAVLASNTEFGRRDFLSCLMTIPICWYWLRGRYYNAARVGSTSAIFIAIAVVALAGVSVTRFQRRNPDSSLFEAAWAKVKAIPEAFQATGSTDGLWGGDSVEASLAAIQLYQLKPTQPFFVEKYVLVHSIPRAWWPDKPEGLGYTLPIDTGWVARYGPVSWGPGVVGHGFQEGGLPYIALYGLIVGLGIRFFDSLLVRDPSNPYLLGIFAASSGQIVGWCRGDVGLFTAMILGAYVSGFIINYIARFFFWTDHIGAATADQPLASDYASVGQNQPEWHYH